MKRYPVVIIGLAMVFIFGSCQNATPGEPEGLGTLDGESLSKSSSADTDRHKIGLQDAQQMIAAFLANNPLETRSWYFERGAYDRILAQDGVAGIRIYGGRNDKGKFSPILVGVAADGWDIVGGSLAKTMADSTLVEIAEMAAPCPPECDPPD